MSNETPQVHTYTNYTLVEENEEFEYRHWYFWYGGTLSVHVIKRRSIHTKTWEATPTDAIDGAPAAYNHEQGYPGSVNPGNLSTPWMLQSVEYTKSISTPLSKDVRETWVCYGAWETIEVLPVDPSDSQ